MHHTVSLDCEMMELAFAIGFWELDVGVGLEPSTNVLLVLFRDKVVRDVEGTLGEVLGIEKLAEELLELEGKSRMVLEEGLGNGLEELLRPKDVLYSGEATGGESGCGCIWGCRCGSGCLVGVIGLAVGTTSDV